MKKILLSLLMTVSVSSHAVTVINHNNKSSPGTVFAQSYYKTLKDASWYQASTCEDAKIKYGRTQDAVMIYSSSVGVSSLNKGLSCDTDVVDPKQVVAITQTYFGVCRRPDSKVKFADPGVRLGIASVILAPGMIRDYNNNGLNITAVPYGGSKDVLTAVIAGDVPFGVIGEGMAKNAVRAGQITCDFSTNPKQPNFVGKTFKLKIPDLSLSLMIYTNSKDPSVITALRKGAVNKEFDAYLESNGFVDTKTSDFTIKDIENFNGQIRRTYETYWK